MFNYEWKREFKRVYLDVQHALNTKWDDDSTMDDNLAAVNALKETCERYMQENEMPIQAIMPTAPLPAPKIDENYPCDKIYACDAKRDVSGQYGSERAILPIPCTNVDEDTRKEWFAKIDEELNELKESIYNYEMYICEERRRDVALEGADLCTAVTSMLEWVGIDEQQRQEAQEKVNEENINRGRADLVNSRTDSPGGENDIIDAAAEYTESCAGKVLPIPSTNVEEKSVKDWFQRINEELDEFKEAVLGCATYEMSEQPVDILEFDECEDIVAEEAADTITAITSMLEAMGIDEEARQEAQKQVNEKNRKRE